MVKLHLNLNKTSQKKKTLSSHCNQEDWFLLEIYVSDLSGPVRYSGQLFTVSLPNPTVFLSDKYFSSMIDVNVALGKAWVGSYHQPHSWRCELKIICRVSSLYISPQVLHREMLMKRNDWN